MADAVSVIREWMMQFLKSRDAFFRKIAEMKSEEGSILVKYKDGKEQKILVAPDFSQAGSLMNGTEEDLHIAIVTLNNKKNKEALVSQWKALIPYSSSRRIESSQYGILLDFGPWCWVTSKDIPFWRQRPPH